MLLGGHYAGRVGGGATESDPYYKKHYKYESAPFEWGRTNYSAQASFYILANLGELNQPEVTALLGKWVARPQFWAHAGKEYDAWLACRFFAGEDLNGGAYRTRHSDILQDKEVPVGEMMSVSRWNALFDIHNFLVKVRNVDTSDVPTIEVIRIPGELPLSAEQVDGVIKNFQDYCKTLGEEAVDTRR